MRFKAPLATRIFSHLYAASKACWTAFRWTSPRTPQ